MATAVSKVFSIPELLENILLFSGEHKPTDLFVSQRVNHAFKAAIRTSTRLRRLMSLEHPFKTFHSEIGSESGTGFMSEVGSGHVNPILTELLEHLNTDSVTVGALWTSGLSAGGDGHALPKFAVFADFEVDIEVGEDDDDNGNDEKNDASGEGTDVVGGGHKNDDGREEKTESVNGDGGDDDVPPELDVDLRSFKFPMDRYSTWQDMKLTSAPASVLLTVRVADYHHQTERSEDIELEEGCTMGELVDVLQGEMSAYAAWVEG